MICLTDFELPETAWHVFLFLYLMIHWNMIHKAVRTTLYSLLLAKET